jgi:AraC family transcriptional regulator of adaptative response/methylated-DNA-[protein]-cysteine methyltransferase
MVIFKGCLFRLLASFSPRSQSPDSLKLSAPLSFACMEAVAAHHKHEAAIIRVCRHIEAHLDEAPDLASLASLAGLSRFHFLRTFRDVTGLTPRGYASLCRMRALKANLRAGSDVTRAMVDAGFSSPSRLYERSSRELGMTPRVYRNGGMGVCIRYTIVPSPLGRMLIAATEKGICAIQFGEAPDALRHSLRTEFPLAELIEDPAPLLDWVTALNEHLAGERRDLRLPLDIQATLFQRRVWEILQQIPYGETRTYAEIAKMAGNPRAVRAVGSACGANPVAVAIPCHRALRSDGSLGGYRWGLSRKVQLLETEKTAERQPRKRAASTKG